MAARMGGFEDWLSDLWWQSDTVRGMFDRGRWIAISSELASGALAKRLAAAELALEKCEVQFRIYEMNHLLKGTPDSLAKAEVNAEMAALCRRARAGV